MYKNIDMKYVFFHPLTDYEQNKRALDQGPLMKGWIVNVPPSETPSALRVGLA